MPPMASSERKPEQSVAPVQIIDASALGPDLPSFPTSHHLIVTTPKQVYAWGANGISGIFQSGSGGIAAAKRSRDGSGMLAVADSEVVVLHDITKKVERSYRLKRGEGHVRLLRYAGDSRSLFFTTSLQNSVQAYSLLHSRLLDPSHIHPSPPTCLALSPNSQLLVSASAKPPTVYVQSLTPRSSPLSLRPSASSAEVTAAAFHPERATIFVLAFADGTLALYDTARLFSAAAKGERTTEKVGTGQGAEIGYLRNVHSPEKEDSQDALSRGSIDEPFPDVSDDGAHISSDGQGEGRIAGAEFLPGFQARVATLSVSGRCTVADFERLEKSRGRFINSWNVGAQATSLAVLPRAERSASDQLGSRPISTATKNRSRPIRGQNPGDCLVAVGRVDGKVCLFDLNGVLQREKNMDVDGDRIIDVEWMSGAGPTPSHGRRAAPQAVMAPPDQNRLALGPRVGSARGTTMARAKRKSLGAILAGGREPGVEVIAIVSEGQQAEVQRSTSTVGATSGEQSFHTAAEPPAAPQSIWQDVRESADSKAQRLFSPISANRRHSQTTPFPERQRSARVRAEPLAERTDARSTISAPQLWEEVEKAAPAASRPSVKSRPAGRRKSRRLSVRQAQSLDQKSRPRNDGHLLAGLRNMSQAGSQGSGGGLALFAPYMQKKKRKEHPSLSPTSTANATGEPSPEPVDLWVMAAIDRPAMIPARKSSRNLCTAPTEPGGSKRKTRVNTVYFDKAEAAEDSARAVPPSHTSGAITHSAPEANQLRAELSSLKEEMRAMRGLQSEMLRRFEAQGRLLERALAGRD
ncbi:MAG: hypothetical protein M1832_000756 [Thelocarpon impressellum]|nr:MAG: hypothetical protein M1832_000756 [Thelocarpon impressellum]